MQKNIKHRARDYEQNISSDYLKSIENGYFNFFKQQTDMKIVLIDTNKIDFVNNEKHYKQIVEAIFEQNYLIGVNRIVF